MLEFLYVWGVWVALILDNLVLLLVDLLKALVNHVLVEVFKRFVKDGRVDIWLFEFIQQELDLLWDALTFASHEFLLLAWTLEVVLNLLQKQLHTLSHVILEILALLRLGWLDLIDFIL